MKHQIMTPSVKTVTPPTIRVLNKRGEYIDVRVGDCVRGLRINGLRPYNFEVIYYDKIYKFTDEDIEWFRNAFKFSFDPKSELFKRQLKRIMNDSSEA